MPPITTPVDPSQQYLAFVQRQAAELRASETLPKTKGDWNLQSQKLRENLVKAWGGFPAEKCDLKPQILGELKRDGFRIEKVVFQTRPGVFMTANAYVPDSPGKHAAVLCVHGHWKLAKQDHKVQARCLGLVKLGFFVLCVDAMGAGERAVGKALGEYHGEMAGATTWPVGLPLSGLQVYENLRAVDYMQSRPEVDATKLGITGASGGGNQSMYSGAFDDRFSCVVPVCSVGRYQAYLGAACCVCEVVPSGLTFTEEWGILSLTAPRALMVINATRDAFQFSIGEARKSLEATGRIYELHGKKQNLRHETFESIHDYSQAMRETMYGWMTLHLKNEGTGAPIPEPTYTLEDPETLRCYPGNSRPDDYMTVHKFSAQEGRRLVAQHNAEEPKHREHWVSVASRKQHLLQQYVLGRMPPSSVKAIATVLVDSPKDYTYEIETEPGIRIGARHQIGAGDGGRRRTALILDLTPSGHPREPRGRSHAEASETAHDLLQSGWDVITIDPRTVGHYINPGDGIGRAPDHNTTEWGLWIGRPLLGQWVWDIRKLLDVVAARTPEAMQEVTVIGLGSAGLLALTVAAVEARIRRVATIGSLATLITEVPYEGQRMGTLAPGLIRQVGDIPHVAAMLAPRPVRVLNPAKSGGGYLPDSEATSLFATTRKVFETLQAPTNLSVAVQQDRKQILESLRN